MQEETSGKFGGLRYRGYYGTWGCKSNITPIDNTPASKVGVKAGDYIVKS